MATQSEAELEAEFIQNLTNLGYTRVYIQDESELLTNLKTQLEKHNHTQFSTAEFDKILNHLNKGNVYERAKLLRDKMELIREDNSLFYVEFFNQEFWCQNQFQVTNQITIEGKFKNRYDVTILVNGLPLIQIELKKRGLELKEAFNQINRYERHSYSAGMGLFLYVQLFVISNGVNTKYFANNKKQSFKQTFYWTDAENKLINNLKDFTATFLEPCHISKMIAKYMVLDTQKVIKVLRPYQYYAVERIIDRVKTTDKNGYIWHTTGSGKTLTSFKASQVLMTLPNIYKVVFVVDRKDLDYQTIREFNDFQEGSVDGTDNTTKLVAQFSDPNTKLIVTTIQKLNGAISKKKHLTKMEQHKDKKIVFIFDECHRSQFGKTHKEISNFFEKKQMIGFTGTPIFKENAYRDEKGKHTTFELFNDCLHKYVITDAIKDENVLKFSVEYVGKYTQKSSKNLIDIEVEDIDKKALMESPQRIEKIVDYILVNHSRKTQNRSFTAILCVSSVEVAIKYYDLFKQKQTSKDEKDILKIATIFTYINNEEDKDANGNAYDDDYQIDNTNINVHTRDKLEGYMQDYNTLFATNFSTKEQDGFYNYSKDIAKKVKNKQIDILLVVNMFLTGFDSPLLNTLYVDKNLQYHGLIQAYSRTNRILDERKSQGNIVCFRNLKKFTDDAITLFSNKEAIEVIIMKPYEDYLDKFKEALKKLKEIAPTVQSVDDFPSEEEEFEFVKTFRELIRQKNILSSFADFDFENLDIEEQEFEDYKSKYLDIHDKVRKRIEKEKVSILDDIDFELELIHRDDITVGYILKLLASLKTSDEEESQKEKDRIVALVAGEATLRSKKLLIEKFIDENLPNIKDVEKVEEEFNIFWNEEQEKAFELLYTEENLSDEKLKSIISKYLYDNKEPLSDSIVDAMNQKPRILERSKSIERVRNKIFDFIQTFLNDMDITER